MQKTFSLSHLSKKYFPKKLSVPKPFFMSDPQLMHLVATIQSQGHERAEPIRPIELLSCTYMTFQNFYKTRNPENLYKTLEELSTVTFKEHSLWEFQQSLLAITYIELALSLPTYKQRRFLILSKETLETLSSRSKRNQEWIIQHLILSHVALDDRKVVANLIKVYYPYRTHLIDFSKLLKDQYHGRELAFSLQKKCVA